MIGKILCFFGFHKWEQNREMTLDECRGYQIPRKIIIINSEPYDPIIRTCLQCSKKQRWGYSMNPFKLVGWRK